MALSKALTGFTPARRRGSAGNSTGSSLYRIANGLTQDLFRGDDVKTTVGLIQRCSATTDYAIGVFDGCTYVDPNTKQPVYSTMWVSATSSADGTPWAYVVDDPNATFYIQADASVTIGDIGLNFDITIGAGSAITKRSGFGLKAGSRGTGIKRVRVLNVRKEPDNAFGDPFPVVEVQWVANQSYRLSAGTV